MFCYWVGWGLRRGGVDRFGVGGVVGFTGIFEDSGVLCDFIGLDVWERILISYSELLNRRLSGGLGLGSVF